MDVMLREVESFCMSVLLSILPRLVKVCLIGLESPYCQPLAQATCAFQCCPEACALVFPYALYKMIKTCGNTPRARLGQGHTKGWCQHKQHVESFAYKPYKSLKSCTSNVSTSLRKGTPAEISGIKKFGQPPFVACFLHEQLLADCHVDLLRRLASRARICN